MVVHALKGEFDEDRAEWVVPEEGNPVGIAFLDGLIGMRDMSKPDSPVLVFTPLEWEAFIGGVKDGEFDVPGMD